MFTLVPNKPRYHYRFLSSTGDVITREKEG